MNEFLHELQLVEELRQAVKFKELNLQLLESLSSSTIFVLRFCKANNIPLPDLDRIKAQVERARYFMHEIDQLSPSSPEVKRSHFSPEDGREPIFV